MPLFFLRINTLARYKILESTFPQKQCVIAQLSSSFQSCWEIQFVSSDSLCYLFFVLSVLKFYSGVPQCGSLLFIHWEIHFSMGHFCPHKSCGVCQERKALTVLKSSHFPRLCLQWTTLRMRYLSIQDRRQGALLFPVRAVGLSSSGFLRELTQTCQYSCCLLFHEY